jgi:hypothetical protein
VSRHVVSVTANVFRMFVVCLSLYSMTGHVTYLCGTGSSPMITPEVEKRLQTLPDRLQKTLTAGPTGDGTAARPAAAGAAERDSGAAPSGAEAGYNGAQGYDDLATADALERARGDDGAQPQDEGILISFELFLPCGTFSHRSCGRWFWLLGSVCVVVFWIVALRCSDQPLHVRNNFECPF